MNSAYRRFLMLSGVLVLLSLCWGCSPEKAPKLAALKIVSGGGQCALPGESFASLLRVRADGSTGAPLAGVKLSASCENGADLSVEKSDTVTDAGGIAVFRVKAGKKTGDQYLRIRSATDPAKGLSVRFVTGIRVGGVQQEGAAGSTMPDPFSVHVVSADGKPLAGVPVYFTLVSEPAGAGGKMLTERAVTDEKGDAAGLLRYGSGTGRYDVSVDVDAPGAQYRSILISAMGLNLPHLLIYVAGGLALFIFGMKLMSSGLQNAAGERMRGLLRFFASNRYVAILAGIVVTAVLQSSSASTVMVIGFINAGLLNLVQSIGIIFGANIGTTITAQLVAFHLESVIMPAIIIGLVCSFISWHRMRGWSDMILGFGLLFFGMNIMSSELKLIADFPSFINFFRSFDCAPAGGVIPPGALLGAIGIGVAVTMLIQSSAATAGIVIALGGGGLINLYTATALVLGSNIGTTITALLAALPANRVAKQAALAHTLFNVIGVILVAGTFWILWPGTDVPVFFHLVNMMTDGNAFSEIPQNLPRHIANAHTLFNVFTTVVLIPFIPAIARICEAVIPVGEGKIKYQYLEPHLLNNPAIALEQSVSVLRRMLRKAWKMVDRAMGVHFIGGNVDPEKFEALAKKENRIDALQYEITSYLTQIMGRKLSPAQANVIPLLMHCTNDAERVADHTENILQLTRRLVDSGHEMSKTAIRELEELHSRLNEQAECAVSLLEKYDLRVVRRALDLEKEIARLADNFEDTHIQRLKTRDCDAAVGVIFIEMLNEVNKISARLSNIVERAGSINRSAAHLRAAGHPEPAGIEN